MTHGRFIWLEYNCFVGIDTKWRGSFQPAETMCNLVYTYTVDNYYYAKNIGFKISWHYGIEVTYNRLYRICLSYEYNNVTILYLNTFFTRINCICWTYFKWCWHKDLTTSILLFIQPVSHKNCQGNYLLWKTALFRVLFLVITT